MQAKLQEQLSPADAEAILNRLPEQIRTALIARAAEIESLGVHSPPLCGEVLKSCNVERVSRARQLPYPV
jgi:hypothetical protein